MISVVLITYICKYVVVKTNAAKEKNACLLWITLCLQ